MLALADRLLGALLVVDVYARPEPLGDPARIVAQVDRIRATLGWTARYDLTDMVASAWSAWTARHGEPR